MLNQKTPQKLMLYGFLLFLTFFSLIRIFASSGGYFFQLELLGLFLLLLLSFVGFIFYVTWGERVFSFVFLFNLVNLLLMWYFLDTLYLTLLILTVIGFLLSIPAFRRKRKLAKPSSLLKGKSETGGEKELHSQVFDPVQDASGSLANKKDSSSKKTKLEAKFFPGKYVASKNSNTYHEPKCDWAKKITPHRRLWFKTKEEAWEKGYKAHSCIN